MNFSLDSEPPVVYTGPVPQRSLHNEAVPNISGENYMPTSAHGTFEVKTIPQPPDPHSETPSIGRFLIDKQFHGDLDGTSKGLMLGAGDPRSGSAGYVAIEIVTGKLNGHSGSFALQHFGTMDAGKLALQVEVVPGSATEELKGLNGSMTITIAEGKHSYDFEYSLPSAR